MHSNSGRGSTHVPIAFLDLLTNAQLCWNFCKHLMFTIIVIISVLGWPVDRRADCWWGICALLTNIIIIALVCKLMKYCCGVTCLRCQKQDMCCTRNSTYISSSIRLIIFWLIFGWKIVNLLSRTLKYYFGLTFKQTNFMLGWCFQVCCCRIVIMSYYWKCVLSVRISLWSSTSEN